MSSYSVGRDPYDIYAENPKLLPTGHENAAEYISAGTRTIEQDSTINDICDFVVEYINSDVLVRATPRLRSAQSLTLHSLGSAI